MAEKQTLQTVSEVADWIIQVHANQLGSMVGRLANKDSRGKFADDLIGRYPGNLGHLDRLTVVDALKVVAEKPGIAKMVKALIADRASEEKRRQASRAPISAYALIGTL